MSDLGLRIARLTPEKRLYTIQTLVTHLEEVGRFLEINNLLALETDEGRNAWYEVKDTYYDTEGYIADVTLAWKIAEQTYSSTDSLSNGKNIALQCRYASIVASINSIATKIPSNLLVALVKSNLLSPAQALAQAQRIGHWERRKVLEALIPYLPYTLLKIVPKDIKTSGSNDYTLPALMFVASKLAEEERLVVVQEILERIRMIEYKYLPKEILSELASNLNDWRYLDLGLATAQATNDPSTRVNVLLSLAPYLSEPTKSSILRETLEVAKAITDDKEKFYAQREVRDEQRKLLTTLVSKLGLWGYIDMALEAAEAIWDTYYKSKALLTLTLHLPEPMRGNILRELIWYDELAKELAPCMAQMGYPYESLEVLQQIVDIDDRVKVLVTLLPYLPEATKNNALQEALKASRKARWDWMRVIALTTLVPHLHEPLRDQVLREMLEVGQKMDHASDRSGRLTEMVLCAIKTGYLQLVLESILAPEYIFSREFAKGETIDAWKQSWILGILSQNLSRSGYPEVALTVARAIRDSDWRCNIFIELIPHLPESLKSSVLPEILDSVRKLRLEKVWLRGSKEPLIVGAASRQLERLARVVPYLPEPLRSQALKEAIEAAASMDESPNDKLAILARDLGKIGQPEQALKTARAINDARKRAEVLLALNSYLPEPLKSNVLREVFTTMRIAGDDPWREGTLVELVRKLGECGDVEGAIKAAQVIEGTYFRANAYAELVSCSSESLKGFVLQQALEIAHSTQDIIEQAEVIATISPHLQEPLKSKILLDSLNALQEEDSLYEDLVIVTPMAKLAFWLPEPMRSEKMREVVDIVMSYRVLTMRPYDREEMSEQQAIAEHEVEEEKVRLNAMVRLIPYLPEPFKSEVLHSALSRHEHNYASAYDEDTLMALAPYLSEPLLRKTLNVLSKVDSFFDRARALTALLPRLAEMGYVQEALDKAQEIEDVNDKAMVRAALAGYLPEDMLRPTLEDVLTIVVTRYRVKALKMLMPRLAQLSDFYSLWIRVLHVLARGTREELLQNLQAQVSIISMLGGKEALLGTMYAIQDLGRWWP